VKDWQRELKKGDYFVRNAGVGIPVYGEVVQSSGEYRGRLRDYRFCKCYSMMCPTGELGDVHISTVDRLLTPNEFEGAKARRWR
jgi:hypothetical protein